ncbi:YgiQ family radical SAM protein [Defluviitalea raffinosedens]|uniref:YgiQ family radical SAM protein n=2 Tax=Defluviitalea raffinosedens TaxID=1450156 RepID=A0A7C8HG53_9FIRM|nr:YgiQ family radical SAM protein [Defluviitalea raffinosedens]KAE9629803.1 YgiQ family radical SAM protein [Defluviitalea raffinosedens]MBM7686596.1 putative radical SAM protein YgiQ [Defluviitalea raffinosedens]HHW67919.1 YgiQ family radical SAM protein [Candidatus Epulonipiscium sp.]
MTDFLPISKRDMEKRGWEYVDFVLISGDAYVDHPSFGTAIIGRILESRGYKVGIIAQPSWKDASDFKKLGKPRLGFLITSGNIDSMVNHYTVAKKRRNQDAYSPGGKAGMRPDRATIVYANRAREAYKDVPIILGGIEASLRRLAHYDYWDNKVRRSILLDSKADLIVYGMGEKAIVEIAEALDSGIPVNEITYIRGTVYKTKDKERAYDYMVLPPYNEIISSKEKYGESFLIQYENTDAIAAKTLIEPYGDIYVVQNPPAMPLSQKELDAVYDLPYMRTYHPIYESQGGIPALQEVKFSIINNRGCFGSCSFCALTFHQGRVVQSRSHESIIHEAEAMTEDPEFKGYIHDVGGPTANFREPACQKQKSKGACIKKQCLFPNPCKQLKVDHKDYLTLLHKLRNIPKVKKVFIRSGIRYDYLIYDQDESFFRELCQYHISGQLKVAPEHISSRVLQKMGKPNRNVYDKFVRRYYEINKELGKNQFLVPYLMSSHPGSDIEAAIELAEYLRDLGYMPEQVQDFYPTPGTLSTCMYYTEMDPRTKEKVYVAKSPHEKAVQRALMQFRKTENYSLVLEALKKAGREDLIGYDKKCLIKPRKKNEPQEKSKKRYNGKRLKDQHK